MFDEPNLSVWLLGPNITSYLVGQMAMVSSLKILESNSAQSPICSIHTLTKTLVTDMTSGSFIN